MTPPASTAGVDVPIVIHFPMPPNLANGRMHWREKHRAKTQYWRTLDNALMLGHIPPPPAASFQRSTIRSVMHLGAHMDDGNAMNRHKWIEDWLVTRGYIADDRKSMLTWESFPAQIVKRDGNYTIEITLTKQPPEERE